ncbi:MAG TPA: glucose-1-phosphate adenylyltransferase [Verrucomicrobiales bacterium]|nr:glucose-1-phosphate adenylyltransferase [Verrucomicrobiales bacterium]
MPPSRRLSVNSSSVLAVIMGGGQGTRLFPLTRERSKPAVPLAGKYRLVDIPISNCINSSFKQVYLLTQFNSASLHRHISQSYKFDHFSGGFVEILAAEQTFTDNTWYQGTADAVRKNLIHLLNRDFEYLLILSGDQLYRMDLQGIVAEHIENKADVTIATIPVSRNEAGSLGIMRINERRKITQFEEKPKDPAVLDTLKLDHETCQRLGVQGDSERFLASMGIYVFNRDVLIRLLDNTLTDFGKHIIPGAINSNEVFAYIYQGYWEDIGTIRSFFEANLDIASELPKFNFFDMSAPIYTRPRFLPASKINGAAIDHAVISDGCIINRCQISHSIVGIRSLVGEGSRLHRVICMGNDYYESRESIDDFSAAGIPKIGIGLNTRIENAIIDKNARIGDNVVISAEGKPENADHPLYFVRDGIVIIPKAGVVPHNTVI